MPAPGYLMNLEVIPPLILPFQFNPDIVSDKKSFRYSPANSLGLWGFDRTIAGAAQGGVAGFVGGGFGVYNDIKEWGSLITATKPLEPQEGEPRTVGLEFTLDSEVEPDMDPAMPTTDPYKLGTRDITNDIAVLRSFMYPNWEMTSFLPELITSKTVPCWNRPPTCTFSYAGISMTSVMTDLDIKLSKFTAAGKPMHAEVSLTLKEQSKSIGAITDTLGRYWRVLKSYNSVQGFGEAYGEAFKSQFISAFS